MALTKFDRETLGRVVREAWVKRAIELHDTNLEHLAPFHHLPEHDKETDRQIGEAVAMFILIQYEAELGGLIGELYALQDILKRIPNMSAVELDGIIKKLADDAGR